ncbi:MAG: hypothetical protein ACLRM8_02195 [Alistipes sp.]
MKIKAFYLSAVAAIVTVMCPATTPTQIRRRNGPRQIFLNEAVGTAKSSRSSFPTTAASTVTPPHPRNRWARLKPTTVYVDEKALDVQQTEQHLLHTASQHQLRKFESSAVIPAGKVVSIR